MSEDVSRRFKEPIQNLCDICVHKGGVMGLSQEMFCANCIHGDPWKKDYFKARSKEQ